MVETDLAPVDLADAEREPSDLAAPPPDGATGERLRSVHPIAVLVLALFLGLTAVLAFTARSVHSNNEERLLRQRGNEVGVLLGAAVSSIQSPLSSGAVLADATGADRDSLSTYMAPLAKSRFASISVWRADGSSSQPVLNFGKPPELAARPPAEIRAYIRRASGKQQIWVVDLLSAAQRRLGYAFATGPSAKYVVYAESDLPANRRSAVDQNSAFSDLDYAIYFGATDDTNRLLAASVANPHFAGRSAATDVPFGDATLRIVLSPRRELGGNLLARLPWLIGGFGIAIALAAGLMTERLVRRREHAERLARQNAVLFSEQRSVAQTLQHSLLPDERPEFPGLELAVRYVPGVDGVDIGGDWYDVIDVGDGQVIVVVGDVSGRGLRAATQMASLRYAIRAYAVQGDAPEVILSKLSRLINLVRDGHFATVLCGLVSVAERRVTFANAGHPSPLLVGAGRAEFVETRVGPPVGVAESRYEPVVVSVPPDATMVAYTDGLFERRGESPDVGLARLRDAATGYASLDGLLDGMLKALTPDGGDDDTAILAVTWRR